MDDIPGRTDRITPARAAAALGVAAVLVVSVGHLLLAEVPLPGTQPADGRGAPGYPAFADSAGPGTMHDPGYCAGCHGGYRQPGEAMHEPWDTWAGSMMAQAARDPLFWAAVDIAIQDDAEHLGDVGISDFCIRCHLPKAWYEGRARCDTPWGEEFAGTCFDGTPDQPDNDWEGITCHYCHRQYDASTPPPGEFADPAAPYLADGRIFLSTDEMAMRGPYADPQLAGVHDSLHSDFHQTSEFCGQCHDVFNPVRNRRSPLDGTDLGYAMPIDATYSEWKQSAFGDPADPAFRSCQDCHMPEPDLDGDGVPDAAFAASIAPERRGPGALPGAVRSHSFVGPSAWMLTVLRDEYGAALGRVEQFDAGIEAAERLLTEQTATIEILAPDEYRPGQTLDSIVRVTNLTGHKFPTGYPEGRRAWVNFRWGQDLDADGVLSDWEVFWESAEYDAQTGILRDPNGLGRLIDVFEAQYGIWNWNQDDLFPECDTTDTGGLKIFHNVLGDCILKDSRIPPLGFVSTPIVEPVQAEFPENPDRPGTLANWADQEHAVRTVPLFSLPLVMDATLYYQSINFELITFLQRENRMTCDPSDPGCDPTQPNPGPNRSEKLFRTWDEHGRCPPIAIATATHFADLAPPLPGEASDVERGAEPLRVSRDPATGLLDLAWRPACEATDHVVGWGPLSGVSDLTLSGTACGLGAVGAASVDPGDGSAFLLVAGDNGAVRGSWGEDGSGAERPEPAGLVDCPLPRDLGATCN